MLVNGRIHTMDARNTVARSVTIRNGRIVAGRRTRRRRAPWAGGSTCGAARSSRTDRAATSTCVSLANRPGYHTILENTTSIREIQETLAARRKAVPEGQWITSMGGWHTNQWAEHRHPTLKELDEAVPDRPVLLYERFTGPCVTNSLGKKFFDAADAGAPVASRTTRRSTSPNNGVIAAAGGEGRPVGQRAVPAAPAADVRGQAAQHDRRDGLFGQSSA